MAEETPIVVSDEQQLRAEALDRLKRKRDFRHHLFVFVLMSAAFWVVWAVTSAPHFPWPVIPMALWGVGVVTHGVDAYRQPFTEAHVQEEVQRLSQRR